MKPSNCTLLKPLSCSQDTNIIDVAKTLRDNRQRRIIVVDEKDYPIGIISTTDMNNKVLAESLDLKKTKASDIMTSPLFLVCDINDNLGDIFARMHEHESYFVPVLKDSKLFGILTYGELIHRVESELKK